MPHARGPHPPPVSIVLPCFVATDAQARLLDETLARVDDQTCHDVEVIVVDDGSPVDIGRLVARHPRTFTVRQPNAGPAVARNTGIDMSRGSTFLFLDAGQQLLPTALETGLAALAAHADAGFVVDTPPRADRRNASGRRLKASSSRQRHLYLQLLAAECAVDSAAAALFRRPVVEALGGFRDPWGADVLDFYLRAAYRFEACRVPTSFTRARRTGVPSPCDVERRLHSLHAVYDRQWSLVRGDAEAEAAHARGLRTLGAGSLAAVMADVAEPRRGDGSPTPIAEAAAYGDLGIGMGGGMGMGIFREDH